MGTAPFPDHLGLSSAKSVCVIIIYCAQTNRLVLGGVSALFSPQEGIYVYVSVSVFAICVCA